MGRPSTSWSKIHLPVLNPRAVAGPTRHCSRPLRARDRSLFDVILCSALAAAECHSVRLLQSSLSHIARRLYATILPDMQFAQHCSDVLCRPLRPISTHRPHCCPNRLTTSGRWVSRGRIFKPYGTSSRPSSTSIRLSHFVKPLMMSICAFIPPPTSNNCT